MKPKFTPNNSFQILDESLAQQVLKPLSLNPNKSLITSFTQLETRIIQEVSDVNLITIIRDTLQRILDALLYNFPENIFWDFDFIVSSMLKQTLLAENKADLLENFGNKIVLLMDMFGRKSEIRFGVTTNLPAFSTYPIESILPAFTHFAKSSLMMFHTQRASLKHLLAFPPLSDFPSLSSNCGAGKGDGPRRILKQKAGKGKDCSARK